jgi:hypothetical protein
MGVNAVSGANSQEAAKWGRLLALAGDDAGSWLPDDLTYIWRHLLREPLEMVLAETLPDSSRSSHEPPMAWTIEELIEHPSPPMELLKLIKDCAKVRRAQFSFPSEIATGLYNISIAVAFVRHGVRMTESGNVALRRGFQWVIRQPWLDVSTRHVMELAIKRVLVP